MRFLHTLAALLTFSCFAYATQSTVEKSPVEIAGDRLEQSARCTAGEPVRVLANDSHLSILGNCTVVTIVGSRNWITVQHARRIVTSGNGNTVLYDDRTTRVEDRGGANSVAERWPQ